MTLNELLANIRQREMFIFGTGYVAEMFRTGLEMHGLSDRVRGCIITHAAPGQRFHGLPVYSLSEAVLPENALLCIAVHESVLNEIRVQSPYVTEKGVWINPYLIDLLYGGPLRTGAVPVSEILSRQDRTAYWITVRYALVREYLLHSSGLEMAIGLYIRALSLHCSWETAVRREQQVERLADSMREKGFGAEYPPIRIDEGLRVIDGLHRMACSLFLQIPVIPAAVYARSDIYDRLLIGKNRLPENVLLKAGFTDSEMNYLRQVRAEMVGNAGIV